MDKSNLKDPSEVNCIVYDQGLFFEQAVTLAKTFKSVKYCVPWESAFPKMNLAMIGYGFEDEGVEIVDSIFPHLEEADFVMFPDLNHGALQEYLVDQGIPVWGSRLGECLETSREGLKEILTALKLPVGKYEIVKGMDNLRTYLKENNRVYVKINRYRGQFETFFSKNYRQVEAKLDEIEYNLGAFKYITEFIVEEELADRVEIGTDSWVITDDNGKAHFPEHTISGVELKDRGYLGRFKKYADLPEPMTRVNEKLKPVFAAYNYRGFMSTEVRIGKDLKPYFIDACTRSPSPPNELTQIQYQNFAECIYYGAHGIVVDPIPTAEYGCELLIHSAWADKGWQEVSFPKEYRDQVKLRNPAKINDKYYCIPQSVGLPEIGAVVGLGSSIKEAIDNALEVANSVEGYYIETICAAAEEGMEQIEKMNKLGLSVFD
jgi:hypothetical protein